MSEFIHDASLLRLLQLSSPALPLGSYAFSHGLEAAVSEDMVRCENDALQWIGEIMLGPIARLDAPLVSRLYHAWDRGDERALQRWNQFLYAARDSREARETDHHLGITLARLLIQLGEQSATAWHRHEETTYALAFSWAARAWNIPLRLSIHAFLYGNGARIR